MYKKGRLLIYILNGYVLKCRSKIRSNLNSIFHDILYVCAFNIAASLPGYAGYREMYQCDWWMWSRFNTQGQGTQGSSSADVQLTLVTPAPSSHGHSRATETCAGSSMRPGFFYGGRVISTRESDRMATEQAQALDKAKHPSKGKQ